MRACNRTALRAALAALIAAATLAACLSHARPASAGGAAQPPPRAASTTTKTDHHKTAGSKLRHAKKPAHKNKHKHKKKKKKKKKVIAPVAQPAGLQPLSVTHNTIMRAGQPFHFQGVNRDTLEWGHANYGGCGGDGHFTDHDFDLIRSWGTTAVRLPLSQAGWLGRACPGADYPAMVDAAIAKINARGMYAIVDLHWSDVQGHNPCIALCLSGQQPMPDADSLTFWSEVAGRYASNPGVVFDLYNEPHDVSWPCWRDGGCSVSPSPLTGGILPYKAVGMQQLYDAVRAQGAGNLVLVAGLQYGYDLSGVGAGYALAATNVAYDTHVYTAFHSTTADWDRSFGFLADRYPVVSTEFGSIDCSPADTVRLLAYFAAPLGKPADRMSWTIWGWSNPGNCLQPSVIADWEGTPLPGQGALIKQALQTATP